MKKQWTGVLGAKIGAVVLLVLCEAAAIAGGLAVYGGAELDVYSTASYYETDQCQQSAANLAYELYDVYLERGQEQTQRYLDRYYLPESTNAFLQIRDLNTDLVLAENQAPVAAATTYSYGFPTCVIEVSVAAPLAARDDFYTGQRWYDGLRELRYAAIAALTAGVLGTLACLLFLFCAAGHRSGTEEIVLNPVDKIPLDLLAAFDFGVIALLLGGFGDSGLVLAAMLVVVGEALGLSFLLSLAARMKKGAFWRNTVIFRLLRWLRRGAAALLRWLRSVFCALPIIWKAAMCFAFLLLSEGLLILMGMESGIAVLLLLFFNALLFAVLCFAALQMRRLQIAGEKLAGGNFEYQLDTSKMYWDFRAHGDNLNSIGAGMSIAVDQKMKSERLKTELITNVSHDIKTPLTSIVNYADLLQRPELTEEERQEYLEVLSRQSRRLKKLTEDLVEASKASTGNLAVNLVPTNVRELLEQAVAEYANRLEQGKLETVIRVDDEDLTAQADGRLLWRVLDNLLGNACKYAMPGTRVYLDAGKRGSEVCISVKNVSRDPLNISADELLERFVRGDTARTTEGSGLGLSIARSLTELQKGTFSLVVDGDLFKAELLLRGE